MTEATLSLVEPELVLSLFGTCDQHLRTVREALGVSIAHRDGEVRVMGDESAVALATEVLEQLKAIAERRGTLGEDDVARVIAGVVGHGDGETQPTIDVIEVTQTPKHI